LDISIHAVGRLRPFFREAADEYLGRLQRYARVTEREVKEAGRIAGLEARQAEEGRRLVEGLPRGATLVALTREGKAWTSAQLAGQVDRWMLAARPLAFFIGGSTGLSPELCARAEARWSLGPLTLPHELARVVVLEQLYRAFTISRGEPYHKGK
jgi:23S rRNA (pseudouridine1915-N3)-methyltransferase